MSDSVSPISGNTIVSSPSYVCEDAGQGNFLITQSALPNTLTFNGPDGQPAVTIQFNPPHVEVDIGMDWDAAAKFFWNAVAKMIGQAPPFGW